MSIDEYGFGALNFTRPSLHADPMNGPTYSIVMPAYNESKRIALSLDKILAHIGDQGWSAEVIVVDDGSRDDTVQIVKGYAQRHSAVRLVQNPGNRGKGYSVRNGMLQAQGEFLLFTDADLSSPIEEASKLFAALTAGADVAIGSRWLRSELQTERQPFYRQLFSRVFNLLLRLTLGLSFKDTQCGFKAFRARAAQALFTRQKIEGWGFDPELLFLARKLCLDTREVPVEWAHAQGTKMNYFRDGVGMAWDALRVRWYAATGHYGRPLASCATTQA